MKDTQLSSKQIEDGKAALKETKRTLIGLIHISRCARPAGFRFVRFDEKNSSEKNALSLVTRLLGFHDEQLQIHFKDEIKKLVDIVLSEVKFIDLENHANSGKKEILTAIACS